MIDGLIRLMNNPDDFTGPVNLGNPKEFTILELAEKVIELTGSRSRLVHKALPVDDPQRRRPNIELAKKRLGWEPRVELDEGLERTIAYFRELTGAPDRETPVTYLRPRARTEAPVPVHS